MAAAEPEGEVIITDPPAVEPAAEGNPEPEGFIFTTMAAAVTTMVTNTTAAAMPKMQPPFFKDAALHWPTALVAWGAAWPLHVYITAMAYVALALWAVFHAVRVLVARQLHSRAYYLALNLVLLACCPGRALFLLVDPYGSAKVLTRFQIRLTIAPMLPSITAAFILVFATLLRVTKMQLVSPRLFSPKMIAFIVLLNYAIGLTTDLLGGAYASLVIMLLCCETYFIVWGIVASSAYFYVFCRLYIGTVVNRRKLNQIGELKTKVTVSSSSGGSEKSSSAKKEQELTTKLPVAAKITLVAAGCFLSISFLHIWRITSAVVYFLNGWGRADHWQWFIYKTLLRLAEVLMCATILYVGSLPFFSKKKK